MLLPKGGVNWKAAKARLPPSRAVLAFLTRTRFLVVVALLGTIILLWRGITSSASEMKEYALYPPVLVALDMHEYLESNLPSFYSFYCWGPAKPPMQMSSNEHSDWNAHLQTPVLYNHHVPVEVDAPTISGVDLNPIKSTKNAIANKERVLILTPLREASEYLSKYFDLLSEITYPHELIDLAFLVGDSTDDTYATLASELDRVQKRQDKVSFRNALIVQKDFGVPFGQTVEERHFLGAQATRRKLMGKARNYLLSAALKPDHSWVYWRDVDIVDSPRSILEDFMDHDKDILVPSTYYASLRRCIVDLEHRHLVPSIQRWPRY